MPSQITSAVMLTQDSGFIANTSIGDKTSVLTDFVNNIDGTMVTALNLISANLGTNLSSAIDFTVIMRKKIQALESSLAANKLPNA